MYLLALSFLMMILLITLKLQSVLKSVEIYFYSKDDWSITIAGKVS